MLTIALAQINLTVGDLTANAAKIIKTVESLRKSKTDLIVFPELAICGYPPEDLLLKTHFIENNIKTLNAIAKKIRGVHAIIGFVDSDASGRIYNAAALLGDGSIKGVYHKRALPNYGVFDEKRYFTPGKNDGVFDIAGVKIGVNICEDIWVAENVGKLQVAQGAQIIINISSSPYEAGKLNVREELLNRRAKEYKAPIVYVNAVGGQDDLIFDGASMAVSVQGKLTARAKQFTEDILLVNLNDETQHIAPNMDEDEEIYNALVLGVRDYVRKNGFAKVALGLSGGIDSALTAVLAVDALGKENVVGISMPSSFNSKATRQDAKLVAKNLGIEFLEIPIKSMFAQYLKTLRPWFTGTKPNAAEENVQARIRGNILMAFANKFGWLVLTTGNKSETAVGYCTLYGDMSGGFSPLKDIFKTKVYALCRWRNTKNANPPIPKTTLLRAPSAELRNDQTDEESLGAYEDLDRVLFSYIEEHKSAADIAKDGLPLKYVEKTIRLVDANEYKRRQAPPGIKITSRAFGKDWRLPITNQYKE